MTQLEFLSFIYLIKAYCENKDLEGLEQVIDQIIAETKRKKN